MRAVLFACLLMPTLCCGESGPAPQAPTVSEPTMPQTEPSATAAPERHTLAVGEQFSCALRGGRVYCWGGNGDGVVSAEGDEARHRPVEVPGLPDVVSLAAGRGHAGALHADGSVSCWGSDTFGRVSGVPTAHGRKGPTRVAGVRGAVQLALGENHSCALLEDGSVWCWGRDRDGELGDELPPDGAREASAAVRVPGLPPATSIAAFGALSAAVVNGQVYFWGAGAYRIASDGSSGSLPRAPVSAEERRARVFAGVSGVTRLALHRHHAFVLTDDGSVFALGLAPHAYGLDPAHDEQRRGPRATPTSPHEWTVEPVRGLGAVTRLATGAGHACALLQGGTLRCWGADPSMTGAGIRGDGQHGYQLPPSTLNLNADEVAGGADHLVARSGDQLVAWGTGWAGQLGQGSTESVAVPVAVVFEAR